VFAGTEQFIEHIDLVVPWQRTELTRKGYKLTFRERSTGPITAVMIDPKHGTFWGAAGNHGEDCGIGW